MKPTAIIICFFFVAMVQLTDHTNPSDKIITTDMVIRLIDEVRNKNYIERQCIHYYLHRNLRKELGCSDRESLSGKLTPENCSYEQLYNSYEKSIEDAHDCMDKWLPCLKRSKRQE
ncbi:hypothetical protein KBC04_02970 [Candidatus Babeliales bacterium]|nr:hypothetical protein [Candidatus Babeliales bacterium]MBP9843986.1 hypothetical protein [Candidatus Babeliales bacterium]